MTFNQKRFLAIIVPAIGVAVAFGLLKADQAAPLSALIAALAGAFMPHRDEKGEDK